MMSHRRSRRPSPAWALVLVALLTLLFVLCGCKATDESPDTARRESHPCRCGERPVLR